MLKWILSLIFVGVVAFVVADKFEKDSKVMFDNRYSLLCQDSLNELE